MINALPSISGSATSSRTQRPLLATVLSGFLGVAKITLLNPLLPHEETQRVAVILNGMSEVDASLAARENCFDYRRLASTGRAESRRISGLLAAILAV
jgi:hypothetical protein